MAGGGRRPTYGAEPADDRPLEGFDLVLMRKDPPVDVGYLQALAILERGRTLTPVLNDPVGVLRSNEKLLPLEIPGASPPTLVTADPDLAAGFLDEHEDVVLKPLNDFSGHGVTRIAAVDRALLVEAMAARGGQHVLLQRFLPEVAAGDKRILVLEGEPLGWVNRRPRAGAWRANIHQGAQVEPTDLSDRERAVIEAARPLMAARGLELAGYDFIGGWLTEINVTSPSALVQIDRVMGARLEGRLVDHLESRAAEGVRRPLPA